MSDATHINLCILWEGELREASRLFMAAANEPDEARQRVLINEAYHAGEAALWGLTDDHACVLVGSDEIRKAGKAAKKLRDSDSGALPKEPT